MTFKKRMAELFDRSFWRVALPLIIPIALQNLLMTSFRLIDTLMVGRLGDVSIAAVGLDPSAEPSCSTGPCALARLGARPASARTTSSILSSLLSIFCSKSVSVSFSCGSSAGAADPPTLSPGTARAAAS